MLHPTGRQYSERAAAGLDLLALLPVRLIDSRRAGTPTTHSRPPPPPAAGAVHDHNQGFVNERGSCRGLLNRRYLYLSRSFGPLLARVLKGDERLMSVLPSGQSYRLQGFYMSILQPLLNIAYPVAHCALDAKIGGSSRGGAPVGESRGTQPQDLRELAGCEKVFNVSCRYPRSRSRRFSGDHESSSSPSGRGRVRRQPHRWGAQSASLQFPPKDGVSAEEV